MSQQHSWLVRLELQPAYQSPATKAAVVVLLSAGGGPLTYRDIAGSAMARRLWVPDGDTPVNTMARDIRKDIGQAAVAGVPSIFSLTGERPVFVSLGLAGARTVSVEPDSAEVLAVHERLQRLSGREFEELVAELLWRMGYKQVVVTSRSWDGGVDARATFFCGPISEQRFVFQVKRRRQPVGQRPVRELCGSLVDDEQGVLIVPGGLTPPARQLAQAWRRPIELVEGHQVAELLLEYGLGLRGVKANAASSNLAPPLRVA